MTEAEANKRWCPFANAMMAQSTNIVGGLTILQGSQHNRIVVGDQVRLDTMCVARGCMLWVDDPAAPSPDNIISIEKHGHCGMAR